MTMVGYEEKAVLERPEVKYERVSPTVMPGESDSQKQGHLYIPSHRN